MPQKPRSSERGFSFASVGYNIVCRNVNIIFLRKTASKLREYIFSYLRKHKRFEIVGGGAYCTNFSCFGYRRGDDGVPVIVPEEAEAVRTIFKLFLDGKSIQMICRYLAENNLKTYTGKSEWNQKTVRDLITNEKYIGDLLLQKSYIEDTISKKTRKNNGELAKYLISNNHPAIVDRDTFNMAQAELASRTNKRKKSELGITEQGKYSAKYALTDVLVCGCCGSHYRRTGKNVKGDRKSVV